MKDYFPELSRLNRFILRLFGIKPYEIPFDHYRDQEQRIDRIRGTDPELALFFGHALDRGKDTDHKIRNMDISLARAYIALAIVALGMMLAHFVYGYRQGLSNRECFEYWNQKFSSTGYQLVPGGEVCR